MADENVKIKIDFDAKTGGLRRAAGELALLEKRVKKLSSGREQAFAERSVRNLQSFTKTWKRHVDFVDKGAMAMGKILGGFLKKSIMAVVAEMAILSATMVGVHALFVAGQLVMKAYRGAMQLLAGGAAAVGVAIASVSAAIREQQAAIFAYRGKGAPAFGSAMNQTRMAMRNLQSDASLATLGVEALNKAYGNMSKSMNTAQINKSTPAIKALMDFGSAGQDPAKGLEQVSIVIAALADKKKTFADVITEAKKLGPEMEQALKKANVKTKKQFESLLLSGDLAKKGGVAGQFAAVNNTLIGQLKSYFTRLRGEFADFGDQFLEPLKASFERMFDVIRRDMQRIMGTVMFSFGTDGMISGFEDAITKTSDWMVRMIREYLPKAQGMFDRMGDWFTKFKRGWNLVLDQTRPLIEGARVLYKAWDPIWGAIKRGATNLTQFRDLLTGHEQDMVGFGNRIAALIDTLSKFFQGLKKMFADMAPFINDLLSGITQVFSILTRTLTMFAGGGFASAFAPLMAFAVGARQLSQIKGRLMPGATSSAINAQTMQVTAGSVIVGGQPLGGTDGRVVTRGGGPLSSGARASATSGGHIGASKLASAGKDFKSTGGNVTKLSSGRDMQMASGGFVRDPMTGARIPVAPQYTSTRDFVQQTQNQKGARFFRSIFGGARAAVQRSDREFRKKENFTQRQQTGRGLGYYLFGKTAGTPFPKAEPGSPEARANASAHADAVMRGYSMDKLAQTAVFHGVTGITDKSTREEIMGKLRAQPGYRDEMFAGERAAPTFGESVKNTARMAKLRTISGLDRAQYGTRRVIGAIRGGMAALNSPAMNPETGEFYDMAKMRGDVDAASQQRLAGMQARGAKFARTRNRITTMRQQNRINRNYGRFGNAYNNRFAKSLGGRMGAGMGLGMLSQVAPEEMRGSMALGATVAQIDPRLGLAVAGIGGALTARGAGKGALSGAAGGAALGAQFGPWGAAIGAGIGALTGAIMGAVNKGKFQLKEAKKAVQESLGRFYMDTLKSAGSVFETNRQILESGGSLEGRQRAFSGIGASLAKTQANVRASMEAAIKAGGGSYQSGGKTEFYDANAILDEFFASSAGKNISKEEQQKMRKRATNSVREYLSATDPAVQKQLVEIDNVNSQRIEALSRATGKSGAELEQLAKQMGVNLYDATIKYDDLLKKFTANMVKSGAELNGAFMDVFLKGANPFKQAREAAEAQNALNQSFRKVGDVLRGGGSKESKLQAVNMGMEQAFSQIMTVAGGDAMKAYQIYQEAFGQGPNGGVFAKGAELAGQSEYFLNNPLFQQSRTQIEKGFAGEAATQIRGRLAEKGLNIDQGLLESSIMNMTQEQKAAFLKDVSNLGKKSGPRNDISSLEGALLSGSKTQIEKVLKDQYGATGFAIGQEDPKKLDKIADAATDFATAAEGLEKAVGLFTTSTQDFFKAPLDQAMPTWWQQGLAWNVEKQALLPPGGDTSTPRAGGIGDTATSKLSQTMARHASLDGQLTGKRTVTSSLRNYALGSINSDHATGSAYDLTGQNLGQYAKLVHANGGFAEFHGSMANRHLHVVPGPGPGIGDTRTVRSTAVASGGGVSPITNHYTFEINGANASPEAIANMVIAKIEARDRSIRERR